MARSIKRGATTRCILKMHGKATLSGSAIPCQLGDQFTHRRVQGLVGRITEPNPAKHPRPIHRQGLQPGFILHQAIGQKTDPHPRQHQRHHQPLALGLGHQVEGEPVTGQQAYGLLMSLAGGALNKIMVLQLCQLDARTGGQWVRTTHNPLPTAAGRSRLPGAGHPGSDDNRRGYPGRIG